MLSTCMTCCTQVRTATACSALCILAVIVAAAPLLLLLLSFASTLGLVAFGERGNVILNC